MAQADVAYFTAPTSHTKPPSQSAKLKLKPTSNTPVVPPPPPDLATPRELKSLANRSNAPPAPAPFQPSAPSVSSKAPTPVETLSTAVPEDPQVGQKRRAEDLPKIDVVDAGPPQGGLKPRPKPPLAKRQKQGPSLFIPKKVCKHHIVTIAASSTVLMRLLSIALNSHHGTTIHRPIPHLFILFAPAFVAYQIIGTYSFGISHCIDSLNTHICRIP